MLSKPVEVIDLQAWRDRKSQQNKSEQNKSEQNKAGQNKAGQDQVGDAVRQPAEEPTRGQMSVAPFAIPMAFLAFWPTFIAGDVAGQAWPRRPH